MDEGFVDLRFGGEHGAGAESFWPSFTDIMMVVLMIFMIASTILMLRNWELVRELRATLQSEQEAEALALTATRTSATLEERLAQAQHEISQLRMRLMRAADQQNAVSSDLASSRQQLREKEQDRQAVAARLQQVQRALRLGDDRLKQTRTENSQLMNTNTLIDNRLQETIAELVALEQLYAVDIAALKQSSADSEQQRVQLQGTYDELNVKYNKLFKPARTAVGKYLVSVRYRKEGDIYHLEFRESEDSVYESVSRKQLESKLSDLKAEHPGKLYVKVIIPQDSGLSYNEAWGFTQEILNRFDYYHQKN